MSYIEFLECLIENNIFILQCKNGSGLILSAVSHVIDNYHELEKENKDLKEKLNNTKGE